MFKSLLVLVLVFSFSPFAFGMDPYLEFFTMDVFFDYKTPEDPELDRLFHEFYVGLSTQHYDDFDVAEFLRNGGDPLAKYLRARGELDQLRNNIMQLLKINNFRGVNTDSDYEVVVSELLQIINFSDNTLNYLKPILRKYENYVLLLSNDEQSKDKALSFFFLLIVFPILHEHHETSPFVPRAGRLALKMLQGKDDVVAHFDFLHKKTPHSLQAYDALDSLKKKFSGLPPIDPLFAERFNEHLVKFKRKYIKQTILWITTTYKLEKAFAKRLVAVCLPLVKIKS